MSMEIEKHATELYNRKVSAVDESR